MQAPIIRIGSRGSPLALAQAREVRARLAAAHGIAEPAIDIRVFKTTGDKIQDRPLAEVGGKGLFTKELEEALLAREIDIAVHSMKDMQTVLPDGLEVGAVLEREDPRDAFISVKYSALDEMPPGAVVGTSSLRREAQVKRLRPDLSVIGFRGNLETRLGKLAAGVADATLLACAGLNRLGLAAHIRERIPLEVMLPAVAQGTIAIELRGGDDKAAELIAPLNHEVTAFAVTAERAFLARLEGSCRTPIAGYAVLDGQTLALRGMTFSPDGSQCFETALSGPASEAAALGTRAAERLLDEGAGALLARLG